MIKNKAKLYHNNALRRKVWAGASVIRLCGKETDDAVTTIYSLLYTSVPREENNKKYAFYANINLLCTQCDLPVNDFFQSPFSIGHLQLPHRLIQGPLAGYSCAPFRRLFSNFATPAYCVSEMLSSYEVLHRDRPDSRFLFRDPKERFLCYQISGHDPAIMAAAAQKLEALGADCIDINCGCPKRKIRKKGAGSALLASPHHLCNIIERVKAHISIPLTVKIRLFGADKSSALCQSLYNAGADALIVHGRFSEDDYATPCQWEAIAHIKQRVPIPVIANGDIQCRASLEQALHITGCDAFMIGRAGTGQPWLFQQLLTGEVLKIPLKQQVHLFLEHIQGLANLENEAKAMLQSKSLLRYYFRDQLSLEALQNARATNSLSELRQSLVRSFEISCIM